MDFHALPRRDLQALCKRNAIRANMSNAAMADALRSLQSVEGIDEIRTAKPASVEVEGEKQRHGCPLPRDGRSRSQAAAQKTQEAPALTPDTLQTSQQQKAAPDAAASVVAEAVSAGKARTRRSRRSRAKGEALAAEQKEPIIEPMLFDNKSAVGRVTRSRGAAHETEDAAPALPISTLKRAPKTAAQEAAVHVDVEEVSTGKRRTRKSRRSKVKVALDEEAEEEAMERAELIVAEKKCDDPKEEAVMGEEATKPQDDETHYQNPSVCSGKRETRKSRRRKVKLALDKEEEVAAAARKEADSSEGFIGSAVVSAKTGANFKEEKMFVVELYKGIADELKPTSTVQKSPPSATVKGSPISVLSMGESTGSVTVRGGGCFAESPVDEIIKMNPDTQDKGDGFSHTDVIDQSHLLVNTLDRFVKPMYYKSAVKEKKEGQCWWMLM